MTYVTNPFRFGTPEIVRSFGGSPSVNSGNAAFTLPPGDAGQVLVVVLGFRGAATFSMASGWTQVYQATNADVSGGGQVSFLAAYKVRGGSETDPTFTRTGGSSAAGWMVGYEASRGSLAYDAAVTADGFSGSTVTIPTFSPTGSRNLLVAGMTAGTTWSAAQAGFVAASLSATAASGTLVPPTPTPVGSAAWQNGAWATRSTITGMQIVDLWDAPAGATGAMTTPYPGIYFKAAAMSFAWSP
jgi:hypothetical protein